MKISSNGASLFELAIVMIAALSPMWLMAGDWSDMDEIWKSGGAVPVVASVVLVYRIWKGHQEEKHEERGES